jgi:hypothetical protein
MTMSVINNVANSGNISFPPGTFNWTVTGPGGYSASGSGPGGTYGPATPISATDNIAVAALGTYNATWTASPGGITCSGSVTTHVVNYPDIRTYGSDVVTGSEFTPSAGTSCAAPSGAAASAGIIGWEGTSSGTAMAAQAMDEIIGFNSDYSGTVPSSSFGSLIFSNNTSEIRGAPFYEMGGNFGESPCVPSYTQPAGTTAWTGSAGQWGTTNNYSYVGGGNLILNAPFQIPKGVHINLYVSGGANVYLGSNIIYSTNNWTKPSDIPSFKVIVNNGNINIAGSVTKLYGSYIAKPNAAGSAQGVISTCANAGTHLPQANDGNYYTTCKNQLLIAGSFVGRQVIFMRGTGGTGAQTQNCSLAACTSTASEVFVDGPQDWLGSIGTGTAPNQNYYQSLIGLPPVL